MQRCPDCGSFVPASVCPECDRSLPQQGRTFARRGRGVLGSLLHVVVSGSAVVTLAACYGAPIVEPEPYFCDDPTMDWDGDGRCGDYDCDESDPNRYFGAYDPEGDGVDQDCDGVDGTSDGSDAGPTP